MNAFRFLRHSVFFILLGSLTISCSSDTTTKATPPSITATKPAVNLTWISTEKITTENGDQVSFFITLSTEPSTDVIINITSTNTAEGKVSLGRRLTFTPSTWHIPQPVIVTGQEDTEDLVDGDIAYQVDLLVDAPSETTGYSEITILPISLINLDNDVARLFVTSVNPLIIEESGKEATIDFRLISKPKNGKKVQVLITSPTPQIKLYVQGKVEEFAKLTFDTLNWNQNQTLTLKSTPNNIILSQKIQVLSINPNTSNSTDPNYAVLIPKSIPVLFFEGDNAGFDISADRLYTSESDSTKDFALIQIKPKTKLALGQQIDLRVGIINDEALVRCEEKTAPSLSNCSIKIQGGNNSDSSQTYKVYVTGQDDLENDKDINYSVNFTILSTTSADAYNNLTIEALNFVNLDNESPGIAITQLSKIITENGEQSNIFFRLRSAPSFPVTVPIRIEDTSEANLLGGLPYKSSQLRRTFSFTKDNWANPQKISIVGVDDDLLDGTQEVTVFFDLLESTSQGYQGLDPDDIILKNVDNDQAFLTLTADQGRKVFESSPDTITTLELGLSHVPIFDVTVDLSISDKSEGVFNDGTDDKRQIIFKALETTKKTIMIKGKNDDYDDGDQVFFISYTSQSQDHNFRTLGGFPISIININDDDAGFIIKAQDYITKEDGTPINFKIQLTARPSKDITLDAFLTDASAGIATINDKTSDQFIFKDDANWNTEKTLTVKGLADTDTISNGYEIIFEIPKNTLSLDPFDHLSQKRFSLLNVE